MEKKRADDRERNWAGWMRAANAGDEIALRDPTEKESK
jgi:hypothetical protein